MARQRILVRRDTAAAWSQANPVLADGEFGLETDTRKLKVGNGQQPWNSLAYYFSSVENLRDLADVDASARVDGSVLIYDGSIAKFVASPLNTKLTLTDGGNF